MVATTGGDIAAELYGHDAAEPLLRAAIHGQTPEERRRASLALAALDPDVPLVVVEAMIRVLADAFSQGGENVSGRKHFAGAESTPPAGETEGAVRALHFLLLGWQRRSRLRAAEEFGRIVRELAS
jgi:hypothetical protein